jgi:hypothetical protein
MVVQPMWTCQSEWHLSLPWKITCLWNSVGHMDQKQHTGQDQICLNEDSKSLQPLF